MEFGASEGRICLEMPEGCVTWLDYCNAYSDLKAFYCDGECSSVDQEYSCKDHYMVSGASEGRTCLTEETTMMPRTESTTCPGDYEVQFVGVTTCKNTERLSKPCKSGDDCNFDDCQAFCDAEAGCNSFFLKEDGGCTTYAACSQTRLSNIAGTTCTKGGLIEFCPLGYETILGGKWTCDNDGQRIAKLCKNEFCTVSDCAAHCNAEDECTTFLSHPTKGTCHLYSACEEVRKLGTAPTTCQKVATAEE